MATQVRPRSAAVRRSEIRAVALLPQDGDVDRLSRIGAPGTSIVVTSSLSLARELWRLGEPELAARVLELSLREVLEVGLRAGEMTRARAGEAIWPEGPRGSEAVLAAIEWLEGSPRPPRRRRRTPERKVPAHLQATEEERWEAVRPVGELLTELQIRGRS